MNECRCSVKIKNLHVKQGGRTVLSNTFLTANHGEILALIGRNGAGKTTLLKAIMRSIEFKGTIDFFNSNGMRIQNPKIGYVPQKLSFDKNTPITVKDLFCANSSYTPVCFWHKKSEVKKAEEMLEKVGAKSYLSKPIGRLSGGELQRVLLALALEPHPDILLLDEPVAAVDRKGICTFYNLINSMQNNYHMPVILVSHDLGHVVSHATSYALINTTVMETGSVKNLLKSNKVRETFGFDFCGGENRCK